MYLDKQYMWKKLFLRICQQVNYRYVGNAVVPLNIIGQKSKPINPIPPQNPQILRPHYEERRHQLLKTSNTERKRIRGRSSLRWAEKVYPTLDTTIQAALRTAQNRNRWWAITRKRRYDPQNWRKRYNGQELKHWEILYLYYVKYT